MTYRLAGTTVTPLLMAPQGVRAVVAEAVHQAARHHLTAARHHLMAETVHQVVTE